jgi:hypothetical protein
LTDAFPTLENPPETKKKKEQKREKNWNVIFSPKAGGFFV